MGRWLDLISDTLRGLQIQLDGLKQFCSNNQMIVNEIKTKVMVFGNPKKSKLLFNAVSIEEVTDYKYLSNIISYNSINEAHRKHVLIPRWPGKEGYIQHDKQN